MEVYFNSGFHIPNPPNITTTRDEIQTAVAHQLCPHKGETQNVFGNWICIIAELSMKHRATGGMYVCL